MRALPLLVTVLLLLALVAGLWAFLGGDAFAVDIADVERATRERVEPRALETAADPNQVASAARSAAVDVPTADAELAPDGVAEARVARGRVLDASGAPVPGARVLALTGAEHYAPLPLDLEPEARPRGTKSPKETLTDAEGVYRFTELQPGKLRLLVRAHGFARHAEERWTVERVGDQALPDLVIAAAVVMTGKVVDRAGAPVPNAELFASLAKPSGGQSVVFPGRGIPLAKSAADGAFVIDELAPGPFELLVDAQGFRVHEEEVRADEKAPPIVIVLEQGFEIAGRVRADQGLPPVVRVTARLVGDVVPGAETSTEEDEVAIPSSEVRARHVLCDAEGVFAVRGLKPLSKYRLSVAVPGSNEGAWKRAIGAESKTAQSGERGVELLWKPETALVFQVVDAETKAPLTELDVWVGTGRERLLRDEKGEPLRTFADGRVRCGELRPQPGKPFHLRVRAAGFTDHENKTLVVAEGESRDLGVIELVRARTVVVRVLDLALGTPIAGARVLLTTGDADELSSWLADEMDQDPRGQMRLWSARTDAEGRARLTSAPGKSIVLGATARGFLPSEPRHELLPAEAEAEYELRLARGGSVLVRVADSAGRPVSGVGIAHRPPGEAQDPQGWTAITAAKQSDKDGLARFENLAPGVHGFALHDETGEVWVDPESDASSMPLWTERAVVEGAEIELVFRAPPRGTLIGRVREGGRPLVGAQLRLTRVREGEAGGMDAWGGPQDRSLAQTDHEGEFRFEGFRAGEYWLGVHHPTRRMGTGVRVTITEEERRVDVDLDIATIEGTITDIEGRPLAGIEVSVYASQDDTGHESPYQLVMREDERGNTQMDNRETTRPSEHTDVRGRFVLRGLATGKTLVVTVQSDTVESAQSGEITLAPDEVKTGVDFRLRRAGAVQVTLAGNPPKPDAWYEVRAFRLEGGTENFAESTWIGAWNRSTTMRGLAPGRYRLVLGMPGKTEIAPERPFPSREVEVRAEETAQASFDAY